MTRSRLTTLGMALMMLLMLLLFVSIAMPSELRGQEAVQSQTVTLIVKMASGVSEADALALIQSSGGTLKSSIPKLRMYVIDVPASNSTSISEALRMDPRVARVEESKERQISATPSDTFYESQWALPKIKWDEVYGNISPGVIVNVAVLDTGIDALHPDLSGVIGTGTSMIDSSEGRTDNNGHGTWVSGIVAAQTNNADGVAGVAFSHVRILPVKVLNENGLGQDIDIINGVLWAADHDAKVILMAFSNPGYSASLQDAINYAWEQGIVLVAATGNDGTTTATFPAGDKSVIGVTATDENDNLAAGANIGPSVFMAAPGTNIVSTYVGGAYVAWSGTSASAAYVAGVAAFMRAADPTLTNGAVVGRLARNADPAGTQAETGNGRLQMARALADTVTTEVQPAGAPPEGNGGPFVGPYRAAANLQTAVLTIKDSGCSANQTTFVLGDTVCASALVGISGGGNQPDLFIQWYNPGGTMVKETTKPSVADGSTQTDTLSLTAGNAVSGTWTVKTCEQSGACTPSKTRDTKTFSVKTDQTITVTTPAPASAAYQSSFNVAATASSGLGVSITTTGPCSGSGTGSALITMTSGTGTCTVHYNQAGNAGFNAAPEVTSNTTATKINQTITVTQAAPANAAHNSSFNVTATASSGLTVAITTTGVCSGSGSASASVTMTSGTGACVVQYNQAGNGNYNAATEVTSNTTATKLSQTITVGTPAPANATYNSSFNVAATASSGLSVAITTTGVCSGSGTSSTSVTMTSGTGSCVTHYNQAGDDNYSAATEVTNSTTAQKATQTITVTAAAPPTAVYNTAFDVTATASSGLTVAITSTPGTVCSGSGGGTAHIMLLSGTGSCVTHYNQAGDDNYSAATEVTSDTTAQKANQTITVGTPAPGNAAYNSSFNVAATSDSLLAVAITTTPNSVCSGSGSGSASVMMITGTGTCVTHYNQAGNSNYNPAPEVTNSTEATKINATCSIVGFSGTYNAQPHGATGNCTGVDAGNATSGGSLNLGGSYTDYPGGTANWTFTGGPNYNDAAGSVSIVINKANATCTINGWSGTYDGLSHGATGSCVGVGTDTAAAGSSLSLGSSFTNYPGGTAYWTFTGGDNYTNKTGNVPITISKRTVTATITGNNKEFDNNTNAVITPCALNTASGNVGVVATDNGNVTCGGTGQFANPNVGTWTVTGTIALSGSASGNYVLSSTSPTTTATIFVCDNAVTRYIGETLFITSGSSTTTAKVTLTASITDPTGLGLAGATVTFTDLLTNKVLAAGVPVSQVPGAPASGTANAIVTLSSGNYGSDSYLILVSLGGNYDNGTQPIVDKTATIVVSQPAAANTIKGGGTIQDTALTGVAGTYLSGLPVTYSVGLNYNNKLTNLQGQIKLTIPQADGSAIVIKSNSLSSMSVTTLPGINNKQATVYTKASISRINADLTTTAIEGGITLRFDVTDMNDDTLDAVGFTALSAKDSTLFYSNDWFFDAATSTWKTRAQTLSSGCIKVGGQ